MSLTIKWQRLIENGETCERCGATEQEVEKAFNKLEKSLKPLGIDVTLQKEEISKTEFEKNPTSSNAVFINNRPLEEWINGDTGKSECCDVCGDENCRTVIINGEEYEVVPSELIIEASLKAASQLENSCCDKSSNSSQKCCGQ